MSRPQNVFEPYHDPNLAHWGPKKPKSAQKLGKIKNKKFWKHKNKKLFIYMSRLKKVLNLTPT